MKVIELNYEDVEVGKTAVKTIEIWNESCKEQIYQAQRDPTTNPMDHVFHLRSYTWALAAEEKFLCEIRYRPYVVSPKNVDYFIITDTSGSCTKIIVRGSSIGPELVCSVTKMYMNCARNSVETKKRIKLINKSKAAATFMIDVDEKCQVFKLNTRHGVVASSSYKYVTITYAPLKDERYTCHLAILILHQEPIIIELYGGNVPSFSEKNNMSDPNCSWKENNGFKRYMGETVNTTGELPPVSLSKHYFNFGQADVDVDNITQKIPQAICLTNHTHSNLLVSWEQDIDGIFNITPCKMRVRFDQSALFELTFKPNVKNNLFGRELVGSVFFEHQLQSTFPIVMSIRVIGHSFPVSSNGWIPQYDIPQTVIMPPCVPPFPVYTTFLIKKFGHLPLMFQFVSPAASHFIVKPMLGVIHQNYQIIIVEMTPENKNEQIYIERWTVYFNGNTKNENCIDFKGYAEYANIIFCNNNLLTFPTVVPHCQQFAQLGMRNVTRHKIRYRFYQLPSEFKMQNETGEIDPNDTLFQECSFSPTEPNVDYDFEVQCVLLVIKNDVIIGSKSCVALRIRGRSEMGFLEAIPSELNFNEIEFDTKKTMFFDLANFSSANIYYKLVCTHRNWPLGDIEKDVEMCPASETVFSGTRKRITISITPRTRGFYEFGIEYLLRINFRSDEIVSAYKPRRICNVNCMSILPTIQVTNVCAFGFKQTFSLNISKPYLWKTLELNKLNKAYRTVLPGGKAYFNIELFPMMINRGIIILKFGVKNPTSFPITMNIEKMKRCSCKPYKKKVGISFERIETNCVHQDLCILSATTPTLQANEEIIITMELRYTLPGKTNLCWHVDIGHDRAIIFNIILNCLDESQLQKHFLSSKYITFGKIYFGNREPIYKTCWMHNVTNNSLPYRINMDNVHKLNEKYRYEIFSCLTPPSIIESQETIPITFKFQPRMYGAFKVTVSVIMGDCSENLVLKGEGFHESTATDIGRQIPAFCACKAELFPAYFNMDCIDLWCIPTHTYIDKMLLVYNNLGFDALAYNWKCKDAPGMISVNIRPRKGVMQPHAVQTFKVKIITKGRPGRIDFNIPCEFLNASQRAEYQKSIIKHTIQNEELKGQFIITEKGTYFPEPCVKVLDKPEVYCKSLTIRCTIVPVEDEHLRISLTNHLKFAPSRLIFFNHSENYNITKDEKELSIITFILEGILWDIVNSERFQKVFKERLMPGRNLYYSQFMMDLAERKRLMRRSYISPPLMHISILLKRMLFSIIHEEFSLKTSHLVRNQDIRHKNYLKLLRKEKQINLKQLSGKHQSVIEDDDNDNNNDDDDDDNDDDDDDDDDDNDDDDNPADYPRTRFRVSFTESFQK